MVAEWGRNLVQREPVRSLSVTLRNDDEREGAATVERSGKH